MKKSVILANLIPLLIRFAYFIYWDHSVTQAVTIEGTKTIKLNPLDQQIELLTIPIIILCGLWGSYHISRHFQSKKVKNSLIMIEILLIVLSVLVIFVHPQSLVTPQARIEYYNQMVWVQLFQFIPYFILAVTGILIWRIGKYHH